MDSGQSVAVIIFGDSERSMEEHLLKEGLFQRKLLGSGHVRQCWKLIFAHAVQFKAGGIGNDLSDIVFIGADFHVNGGQLPDQLGEPFTRHCCSAIFKDFNFGLAPYADSQIGCGDGQHAIAGLDQKIREDGDRAPLRDDILNLVN